MTSPIDAAWNVVKGEAFHPSVAGYMAAGHGGERDQAILEEMRRMEEIYNTTPLNEQQALEFHNKYMELEDSLSDDPHALQNRRAARPNAERENRPRGFINRYGEYDISRQSTDNMQPRRMLSGKRDALRLQMSGRGKAVGPTGELDTLAHIGDEPIGPRRTDTQSLADRLDREQEARLPEMGSTVRPEPMLQRSSDAPIDSAWSILKELSREDLEMAARTGGVPRMSGTMRPEFYGRPNFMDEQEPPVDMMTPLSPMNQPITDDFGNIIVNPKQTGGRGEFGGMMQEYNEAIFPDEEAEYRRINAPTPVSTPGVGDPNRQFLEQRLQDMNYEIAQMNAAGIDPRTNLQLRNLMQERMKLMHRIGQRPAPIPGVPLSIEEAGDASMPDPSQMEHLGAQLAHADMMRDDISPDSNEPIAPIDIVNWRAMADGGNLFSESERAPNRQAYMTRR